MTRSTNCPYFCTFGIQEKNHEKRAGQASSGQCTRCPRKEAIQPQQLCLREQQQESAHVHAALSAEVGTTLIQKMESLRRGERRPESAKKANFSASTSKNCKKFLFLILFRESREWPFLSVFSCCPNTRTKKIFGECKIA